MHHLLGIDFSIVHVSNRGAAWGMLPSYQISLLLLRIALIIGMSVYLLFFNRNGYQTLPLTLVIAGASGNVVDTMSYGHVIDMFHFVFWGYDFPAFNIADSAICIGISWLFLLSFSTRHRTVPVS